MQAKGTTPMRNLCIWALSLAAICLVGTNAQARVPSCHLSLAIVQTADDSSTVLLAKHSAAYWYPMVDGETGQDLFGWPSRLGVDSEETKEHRVLLLTEEVASSDRDLMLAYYSTEDGEPLQDGTWSLSDREWLRFTIPPLMLPASPPAIETQATLSLSEAFFVGCCFPERPLSTCYSYVKVEFPDGWRRAVGEQPLLQTRVVLDPVGDFFAPQETAVESFIVYTVRKTNEGRGYLVLSSCDASCNGLHLPDWYGGQRLVGAVWPYGLENPEDLMLRFEIDLETPNREIMETSFASLESDAHEKNGGCSEVSRPASLFFLLLFALAMTNRALSFRRKPGA